MKKFCSYFLRYILVIVLGFLMVVSVFTTQRCGIEGTGEIMNRVPIYKVPDNLFFHGMAFLLLGMACVLLSVLRQRKNNLFVLIENHLLCFQVMCSCLAGGFSFWVFLGGVRTPIDDQIQVYSAAQCFNAGNYINLTPGGYVDMYPQQMGYILFLQLVLRFAGTLGFQAVQMINCILIAGVFLGVCLLLDDLTEHPVPRMLGTLLLGGLVPLYLLQSWVYGDIPFFLFAFLFMHFFFRFMQSGQKKHGILGILAAILSVVFRKNALILIIAAILVLLILFFTERQKQYIVIALCLGIFPLGATAFIEQYYQNVSGYEITGGLPAIAWITMGTIENGSAPGWFNNYSVPIYYSVDYNRDKTAELAALRLQEQMKFFEENPVYALSFWKRKITTQWNDPFFHTNYLIAVDEGQTPYGVTAFLQEHEEKLLVVLSLLQGAVYLGSLLYVLTLTPKIPFYKSLPMVYFIGGFLFSLIWEANSRYVMPYYMILFPLAAIGWHRGVDVLARLVCRSDSC